MSAGLERRDPTAPRIPLDLLVQLSHEDYDEPFDADSVDVSRGGLALRADYLPEIGDRLRCRFECPPDGEAIELDGEVVWAHDAGERSGEFGLRFHELDLHAEGSLQKLLTSLGGHVAEGPLARLHLAGVATPIEASVVAHTETHLRVEQELPFLRIGMGIAIERFGVPPRGELARVELRMKDGVPCLVMEVALEGRASPTIETPSIETPSTARPTRAADEVTLQDHALPPALREEALAPTELAAVASSIGLAKAPEPANDLASPPVTPAQKLAAGLEQARALAMKLTQAAKPRALALAQRLRAWALAAWAYAGPGALRVWALLRAGADRVIARLPIKRAKRRTVAAPSKAAPTPRKRKQKGVEAEPPRRNVKRIVLVSAIAFAAVGATVYALVPSEPPAPAPIVLPPVAAPPPPIEPAPVPAQELGEVAPQPAAALAPALVSPGAALEPAPAPEAEAGRLDAPTFPSLADARARAAEPAPPGTSFGDANVSGRPTTLRMSQPVTELRGQREADGFTLTIPGALALDRAAPLASTNPSVERASILNRGDHAVLSVRFVPGRMPPYRVVARGAAIEVTIGR